MSDCALRETGDGFVPGARALVRLVAADTVGVARW